MDHLNEAPGQCQVFAIAGILTSCLCMFLLQCDQVDDTESIRLEISMEEGSRCRGRQWQRNSRIGIQSLPESD